MSWAAAITGGWKVWTTVKPVKRFKRWRAKRKARKEGRELTSEQIELETMEDGMNIKRYRKLIVVVVGAALTLGARFVPALEDADAAMLVDAVIMGGTAIGVFAARNEDDD